jgi:hypothetical protein
MLRDYYKIPACAGMTTKVREQYRPVRERLARISYAAITARSSPKQKKAALEDCLIIRVRSTNPNPGATNRADET